MSPATRLVLSIATLVGITLTAEPLFAQQICQQDSATSAHGCGVSANLGWQQTPVSLQSGDKSRVIFVVGAWSVGSPGLPYVGPEGYSPEVDATIFQGCKYDSSVPYGTLLGQIGGGPEFVIGAAGDFTANASGNLSLRINDIDRCLGDNDGSITVAVAAVAQTSNQPPVISLLGDNPLVHVQGCPFIDPGADATDKENGDLTNSVVLSGGLNIAIPGTYSKSYTVTDSDGLSATQTRQLVVSSAIGTPTCFSSEPQGQTHRLIVLVHGCCTDQEGLLEWHDLATEIAQAILLSPGDLSWGWEIVVWDWTAYTPKRDIDLTTLLRDPLAAYNNILDHSLGEALANAIASYPYKYVHLVGHSAGAKLIQSAAETLASTYKANNADTFIHLTFLDAFTHTRLELGAIRPPVPLSKSLFGALCYHPRSARDRRVFTQRIQF